MDEGEIIIISLIMGNEVKDGEFAKISISRYMPVVISDGNRDENSVFLYAYTITGYDYDDAKKDAFQRMIDNTRILQGVLLTDYTTST